MEKRSIGREAIHQPVSFEVSARASGRFGNLLKDGFGVDIGNGGVGLITDYPLEEGDVLKLYYPVSTVNTSLPVYTEVMWSAPADGKFRAGLRFLA